MTLYRIAWIYKPTEFTGHGDYIFTYEKAAEIASLMNEKHPDMKHWTERQTGEEEQKQPLKIE
jgi:hypothetical protein